MSNMYKPAKTLNEQLEYLNKNKRVQFNDIDENKAKEILFKYNYINVITPYKHHFAKLDEKKEVIKVNGSHIYERDVEFSEYLDYFKKERSKYPIIAKNVIYYETIFKSILSYRILTNENFKNEKDVSIFLDSIRLRIAMNSAYNPSRLEHMNNHIIALKESINKYADVYCFFDRMSLGVSLTIFSGLDKKIQKQMMNDFKNYNMNFGVMNVNDFINKIFTLVSIRNCVMHCNSLEILIRFYNPTTHDLRKSTDRKRYLSMIRELTKEKPHNI